MKAVRIHAYGGPEQFRIDEVPDPVAGPGEVLVRVAASGLNPVDSYARQGFTAQMFPMDLPAILGCDAAGTVEAVGSGVTGFRPGNRVVVRVAPNGRGTHADLVAAPAAGVAHLPEELSFEDGATLPLVGLTGRQLVEALGEIASGDRVLVAGALGAVGRSAVQYLEEVGAIPVAGVRGARLDEGEALAGDAASLDDPPEGGAFDLAIAAAAPAVAATVAYVRDGGRVVSAVQVPDEAKREGVAVSSIMAHDDAEMLQAVVAAAERGELEIPVAQTFPLDRLADAHRALDAHPSGKIIIVH